MIMLTNMNMVKMKKINCIVSYCLIIFLNACSISPGINEPISTFSGDDEVYIVEKNLIVPIVDLDEEVLENLDDDFSYTVSPGDVLTFVIWGLEDVFPTVNFGSSQMNPQNSRTVDSEGMIYFPFAGYVEVNGLSVSQVREKIYKLLSNDFIDPQIDVTVSKYNENRRAYLMGEVLKPQSFYVGIEKLSLTDAVGLSNGLDPRFSNAEKIYIVRSYNNQPTIYRVSLKSPEKFLISNNFYIRPNDIIYVAPSGITRWNRFFSQIFPFASFFNQIDNIRD